MTSQIETHLLSDITNQMEELKLVKTTTVKKEKRPLFIGVELVGEQINQIIASKIPTIEGKTLKEEFHSTLEFKPKDTSKFPCPRTKCTITIEGFGISDEAIAFKVSRIVTDQGVPVFQDCEIPHITVALAEGVKPADSWLSIRDGVFVGFEEPITVDGKIKLFFPSFKPKTISK